MRRGPARPWPRVRAAGSPRITRSWRAPSSLPVLRAGSEGRWRCVTLATARSSGCWAAIWGASTRWQRSAGSWAPTSVAGRSTCAPAQEMGTWLENFDAASPIDVLIANAGIMVGSPGEGEVELAHESHDVIETNVNGVLNVDPPAASQNDLPGSRADRDRQLVGRIHSAAGRTELLRQQGGGLELWALAPRRGGGQGCSRERHLPRLRHDADDSEGNGLEAVRNVGREGGRYCRSGSCGKSRRHRIPGRPRQRCHGSVASCRIGCGDLRRARSASRCRARTPDARRRK